MTRSSNWYPDEIYYCLLKLGHENNLAYNEVAFMLLREALAPYGFDCCHKKISYPKKPKPGQNKPFCPMCYTRLEKIEEKILFKGKIIKDCEFRAIETFVDVRRKENLKKLEIETDEKIKAEVDKRFKALVDSAIHKDENRDNGQ